MNTNNRIMVSVLCVVFNHAKFLRKCLDGLVNQETNFAYEIIVHDDCSTDGSIEIIKEYAKKYTNIVAFYEKENQYSRGIGITRNLILPHAKGKYIALCEGDDYWTDNSKLQKQFSYMETHDECVLCVHNTIFNDLLTGKKHLFNDWKGIHQLTDAEVIRLWKVHTTSYFFRYNVFDYEKELPSVWCGDYARLVYAFSKGSVVALPYVMSVYNYNNFNGMTFALKQVNNNKKRLIERLKFTCAYNKYTKFQYDELINDVISTLIRRIIFCDIMIDMGENISFSSYRQGIKTIKKKPIFKQYWAKAKGVEKLKGFALFNFYSVFRYVQYRNGFKI